MSIENRSRWAEDYADRGELSDKQYGDIEKALATLKERSEQPGGRIREESFVPPYAEESVRHDIARVKKIESVFAQKAAQNPEEYRQKLVADTLELIIWNCLKRKYWLGGNVNAVLSARFDDYENGVDLILEIDFQETEGAIPYHVALAIDVTFCKSPEDKLREIKSQIDSGTLSTVKYFHQDKPVRYHGQQSKIPRVVVATTKFDVANLAALTNDVEKSNPALLYTDMMHKHDFQYALLEQVAEQLTIYSEYARKNLQTAEGTDTLGRLQRTEGIIRKLQKAKLDERIKNIRSIDKRFATERLIDAANSVFH